ncbi:MAG: PAS domain-containing protein [Hyphomicrobiales bacterium]|nr:PAS domain-containing protein [Hyphomicrobiales bacterium]
MKHGVSRELYDYWQRLRGDRPAPDRTEIEPYDLRRILGDTFILEANSRSDYRFRLAGTRVCALYGRELKGRDFLTFFTGKDRDAVATLLAAVSQDAAAAVFGFEGRSAHDRVLPCEALLLPVRQKGEGWTRIIGSIAPMDDPYWIGIHPIVKQSISSLRLIWPDERPSFLRRGDEVVDARETPAPTPAALHARPPSIFRPAPRGISGLPGERRVGHLVVLDGGKSAPGPQA